MCVRERVCHRVQGDRAGATHLCPVDGPGKATRAENGHCRSLILGRRGTVGSKRKLGWPREGVARGGHGRLAGQEVGPGCLLPRCTIWGSTAATSHEVGPC